MNNIPGGLRWGPPETSTESVGLFARWAKEKEMRNLLLLVAMMFVFSMNLVSAPKTEIVIDELINGFESGQFAIVDGGEVSKNLEGRIIPPIRKILQEKKGDQIRISIIGYTDTRGSSSLNQDLGDKRALQTKAFIGEKLAVVPLDNITTRTVGDAENNRAVRVICTLMTEAVLAPPQRRSKKAILMAVLLWIFVLFLGIYFINKFVVHNKKPKKELDGNGNGEIKSSSFIFKEGKCFVRVSDPEYNLIYLVEVWKDSDGIYVSHVPLMNVSESTSRKVVHGKNVKEIIRNLKGCFINKKRSAYYRDIFEEMSRKKIISFE